MHIPNLVDVDVYESAGGYSGLRKALREHQPSDIIEIVKQFQYGCVVR